MSVATIRQPRTICSLENYDPPRREKLPLWNTETLQVHRSFISKSFTTGRLPTVKQRSTDNKDCEQRSCIFSEHAVSVLTSHLGSRAFVTRKHGLRERTALFTRHLLKNSQPHLEIARWLEVEELPTVRFDTIATFRPSCCFESCLSLQIWCVIAGWRV